jgi:hypothetical protein
MSEDVPHRLVNTAVVPNSSRLILTCKCGATFSTLKEMRKHREKGNATWVRARKPTDALSAKPE